MTDEPNESRYWVMYKSRVTVGDQDFPVLELKSFPNSRTLADFMEETEQDFKYQVITSAYDLGKLTILDERGGKPDEN